MASFPPWTGFNFVPTLHHETIPETLLPRSQSLPSPFVVCVTGASRNVGAETAKAFASAGATGLILTARTEAALKKSGDDCKAVAKSAELKITTFGGEIGSVETAKRLAAVVEREHGRIDCLVNNAGIMATNETAFQRLESMDDDQIQIPLQVNTIGRVLVTKYLLPLLLRSPGGTRAIVNITSMSSHFTSGTPMPFNISELATNRFTEYLAEQYAADGVVAFAVHPGTVKTDFPPGFPEAFKEICVDDPGLCGAFLVWLVKEKREWLSGRYLHSNWDVAELEGKREEIVSGDKLKMRMTV
jgi:NAD(P)-dependent dehydrogenase (short-subunit alcohol dehydrogenase family)